MLESTLLILLGGLCLLLGWTVRTFRLQMERIEAKIEALQDGWDDAFDELEKKVTNSKEK